jgi:deoxyribodipyrimidine photolyase
MSQDDPTVGPPAHRPPAPPAVAPEVRNQLEKVRDILFGAEKREIARGIDALRRHFEQEGADLRADSRRRIDALESFVKAEVAALHDLVRAEQAARLDAAREMTRQAAETLKAIDDRLARHDQQFRELRQQLLEQSGQLRDEAGRAYGSLSAALEQVRAATAESKLDRSAMAQILASAAAMLGESPQPGGGV